MPTRVVLREPPPPSAPPRREHRQQGATPNKSRRRRADSSPPRPPGESESTAAAAAAAEAGGGTPQSPTPQSPPSSPTSPPPRFGLTKAAARSFTTRSGGGGGSGLLREEHDDDDEDDDDDGQQRHHQDQPTVQHQQRQDHQSMTASVYSGQHLSRRDIVASPRLVGYMFNFIASLVLLVSAVQFEQKSLPGDVLADGFNLIGLTGWKNVEAKEGVGDVNGVGGDGDGEGRRVLQVQRQRQQHRRALESAFAEATIYEVAVVGGPGPTLWYDGYGVRSWQERTVRQQLQERMMQEDEGGLEDRNETDGSGSDGDLTNESQPDADGDGDPFDVNATTENNTGLDGVDGFNSTTTALPNTSATSINATNASETNVNATSTDGRNATNSPNGTAGSIGINALNLTNGPSSRPSSRPSLRPSAVPTLVLPTAEPTISAEPTVTIAPTLTLCPPSIDDANGSNGSSGNYSNYSSNGEHYPNATLPPHCLPTPSPTTSAPSVRPSASSSPSGRPSVSPAPTPKPTQDNFLGCTTDCGGALPRNAVSYWKMWAAVIIPATGCFVTLCIMLAHFDNVCCPDLWRTTFKDGSRRELCVIWSLIAFWIAGLYCCTSVNSVGYVQANVYFSSWAAFGTALMNWKLWREGADKRSLLTILSEHSRKTTKNWFWTLIFSIIALFSLLDLYMEKLDPSSVFGEALARIQETTWRMVWILTGTTTATCAAVPLINHALTRPGTDERYPYLRSVRVAFRQVEGAALLALVSIWCYIITKFTGPGRAINGINNPYFGTWGTFFNCILAFGSWLHDKKNVSWVDGDAIVASLVHHHSGGGKRSLP